MNQRAPLLVTGMHRSGTSMVTRLLNLCGLHLGAQERLLGPHETNQAGFWENEEFVNLDDLILERLDGAWDAPPTRPIISTAATALVEEFGATANGIVQAVLKSVGGNTHDDASDSPVWRAWGWKDPRTSLLLPFWRNLHPDLKVIVCLRNPLDVAVSLQNRGGSSERCGLDLWLRYNRTLWDDLPHTDHIVTHYESYFNDPELELRRLLDWLGWPVAAERIQSACQTIKKDLQHSCSNQDELEASPRLDGLMELYREMCATAGPICQAALDTVAAVADSPPRVSIVIPTFNKLAMTRQCLRVLRQHTPRELYELIVVDNGSYDGTGCYLRSQEKRFPLRAILNHENRGFAAACNQGAAAARGEYVLFLNNDTEPHGGWLESLVEILDHDPRVAAVGSKLLFADGTIQHGGVAVIEDRTGGDPLGARHLSYQKPADAPEANRPLLLQAVTAACALMRREAFDAVGAFDEDYWNGYEDVDLCFKLKQAGWNIVYEPRSILTHHESQSGAERFSRWPENVKRLQERWSNKVQPDYIITEDRGLVMNRQSRLRLYQRPLEQLERKSGSAAGRLTSIVVLCYNALACTERCVSSLLASTTGPYELILVDNGSTDRTLEYLRDVAEEHEHCRLIANSENLGYAAGNNLGLAATRGEYVVLVNNDVVVTRGWLDRLLDAADRDDKVGIVGPMTNNISGPQKLAQVDYDTRSLDGLEEFAAAVTASRAGVSQPYWRAVGFCILIKRAVIDRIGGLDERFGRGNFEDDDFCLRALLAGFETRLVADCFVHHYGTQSFLAAGLDYETCLRENWEIFKAKWEIPAEVSYGASYDLAPHLQGGFDPAIHHCPLPSGTDGGAMATSASPATSGTEVDERLVTGEELFRAGRLDEAAVAFAGLLAKKPDHRRARNNLACVRWQQGATDEALAELTILLTRDPDNPDNPDNPDGADIRDAAFNLGQFLHGLGRRHEATQLYQSFASRFPADQAFADSLRQWRGESVPQPHPAPAGADTTATDETSGVKRPAYEKGV